MACPLLRRPALPLQIDNALLRRLAKLGAAYRAALRPRLLVLVGVAALIAAYNKAAPEPLPLVYEGCILGGFLSYKVALLVKLFDELSPKVGRRVSSWPPGWAVQQHGCLLAAARVRGGLPGMAVLHMHSLQRRDAARAAALCLRAVAYVPAELH